jgi:WD40 repeat protein
MADGESAKSRFAAFISYAHASDTSLARVLQRALERFTRPWYRRRAVRVFRDEASLAASPRLWSSVQAAMSASDHFILIASRESAASAWVGREVEHWLRHRSPDTFLVVLSDGQLGSTFDGRIDWSATTCLPAAAEHYLVEEPRYVDLRWSRSTGSVDENDARFRMAIADLAAPLHGVPKDDLATEDLRQHRRTIRTAWAAGILLAALSVLASVTAWVAVGQRNEARDQRNQAFGRQFLAQAATDRVAHPDRSLLLALEAEAIAPSLTATKAGLFESLRTAPDLVRFLGGHKEQVQALAYSPDGGMLVSGGGDGRMVIHDTRTWEERAVSPPTEDRDDVDALAFTGDGTAIYTVGHCRLLRHDPVDLAADPGVELQALAPTALESCAVRGMQFSPGAELLAGSAYLDDVVGVWDVPTGDLLAVLEPGQEATALSFSPDGRRLAVATADGVVSLWDISTNSVVGPTLSTGADQIEALRFDQTGDILLVGGSSLEAWHVTTGERLAGAAGLPRVIRCLWYSASGTLMSGYFDGGVGRWSIGDDFGTFTPEAEVTGHDDVVFEVVGNPDGTQFVTGSNDRMIGIWEPDPKPRLVSSRITSPAGSYLGSDFSPDGELLAVGMIDRIVRVYDTRSGKLVSATTEAADPAADVVEVAFSPDGAQFTASGGDLHLRVWDTHTGRTLGDIGDVAPEALTFVTDDTVRYVDAIEDQVMAWNVGDDRPTTLADVTDLPALTGLEEPYVTAADLSADGSLLAVVDEARPEVVVAAVSDDGLGLEQTQVFRAGEDPIQAVTFSPDGERIAFSDFSTVWVMETDSGRHVAEYTLVEEPGEWQFSFTADGQTLAMVANGVWVWDLADAEPYALVAPPAAVPSDVAFSPVGPSLAVSSQGVVNVWSFDRAHWRRLACQVAGRNLLPEEWRQFMPPSWDYHRTCSTFPDGANFER